MLSGGEHRPHTAGVEPPLRSMGGGDGPGGDGAGGDGAMDVEETMWRRRLVLVVRELIWFMGVWGCLRGVCSGGAWPTQAAWRLVAWRGHTTYATSPRDESETSNRDVAGSARGPDLQGGVPCKRARLLLNLYREAR